MEKLEETPPANTIDVTSDAEKEAEALPSKRSHGGVLNTKRFGEKLLSLEAHNIRYFLAEKRCYCGEDCLLKLS